MNHRTKLATMLMGTALTVAFSVPSSAQTLNVNTAELEGKSQECRSLGQFIADRNGVIDGVEPTRVADAVNGDVAQECAAIQATLAQGATAQGATGAATDAEGEASVTTETVDTAEQATIVGEAVVRVPEPNVDVRVPQPEVTVTRAQPQVSVRDGAARIEVEQLQPEIAVEIPTINVRVTMPAPRIYVLQDDPEVSVTEADPQVEVVQGEPQITVTQPDPELDIDLGLASGDEAAETATEDTAQAASDGAQQVSGDVEIAQERPLVTFVAPAEAPMIEVTRAEPQVTFAGAEPNVTITMSQEPTVDVQMAGEPQITIETAEEREQRLAAQEAAGTADAAPAPMAAADATAGQMTVGDLMGMDVVTADGENLGNPEAVIDENGQQYLLLSSGGFLDIGDKIVPVPMANVSVVDDQLVLGQMTEEDVERARDFEYNEEAALEDDRPVMLSN